MVCSSFSKKKYEKNSVLGDKGLVARDIIVYYRPIPKIEPRRQQSNGNVDRLDSKKRLFTDTM